ncbi:MULTISPECIES: ABC transporter permease [Thalassospira]|uniref:ABC transporter permease n=1 Tax=Thalassospira aquimaris TaxID=3037796 RepID=A0ABT6GB69_9PROT|nr:MULTISPECIES: ABC transporter permease [Thalassospira]MDG4719274.1 ABC transporter permease [Thalassospira sp. FZY0004]
MGVVKDIAVYFWSVWGALVGLFLFVALWEAGHAVYGDFILPAPADALARFGDFVHDGSAVSAASDTAIRAIGGFAVSGLIGSLVGVMAGLSITAARAVRPVVTVLLGIPPIAWIVLALLWFGPTGMTPMFTVIVTSIPITFAGAVEGTRTLDRDLEDMARIFRATRLRIFVDVHLPHILSYLFPAWITALGMAWKVAVMAELLATSDGIGARMATARVNLDMAATMAWIVATVGLLLMVEYLVLEPLKRRTETWRQRPAGHGNSSQMRRM